MQGVVEDIAGQRLTRRERTDAAAQGAAFVERDERRPLHAEPRVTRQQSLVHPRPLTAPDFGFQRLPRQLDERLPLLVTQREDILVDETAVTDHARGIALGHLARIGVAHEPWRERQPRGQFVHDEQHLGAVGLAAGHVVAVHARQRVETGGVERAGLGLGVEVRHVEAEDERGLLVGQFQKLFGDVARALPVEASDHDRDNGKGRLSQFAQKRQLDLDHVGLVGLWHVDKAIAAQQAFDGGRVDGERKAGHLKARGAVDGETAKIGVGVVVRGQEDHALEGGRQLFERGGGDVAREEIGGVRREGDGHAALATAGRFFEQAAHLGGQGGGLGRVENAGGRGAADLMRGIDGRQGAGTGAENHGEAREGDELEAADMAGRSGHERGLLGGKGGPSLGRRARLQSGK